MTQYVYTISVTKYNAPKTTYGENDVETRSETTYIAVSRKTAKKILSSVARSFRVYGGFGFATTSVGISPFENSDGNIEYCLYVRYFA